MESARRTALGLAAIALGALVAGCDGGGSGSGTLVIVNDTPSGASTGGNSAGTSSTGSTSSSSTGSSNTSATSNPPPASGFTVVKSDPGGGTILQSSDGLTRKIAGTFHEDVLMEPQYSWILDAPVFIGAADASKTNTLRITAGTKVYGRGGTPPSMLVIRRSAKLDAQGTAASPIVFTSAQPAGSRAPGDWGGIVINGKAPVNNMGAGGALPFGEGGSGQYGGADPNDSSGTLRYVRVEFAGHVFTSDDELNGVAFQGVGSGTTVDYLQVHRNADDGVEFFGGTVNVKHLLVTGALDDSFDWTFGWSGKAQFVVLQQWVGGADCAIEADNNETSNDAAPRARPTISNLTIVGPAGTTAQSATGLLLRRGTGARISNAIVMEMNGFGLDIDGGATWNNAYTDDPTTYTALSGELTVKNTIFHANGATGTAHFRDDPVPGTDPQTDTAFSGQQTPANQLVDPQLGSPTSEGTPNFRPATAGPASTTAWSDPGDAFFTPVDFLGAVDDVQANDWTTGWTTSAAN
jgi:hypothetical protein